MGRRSLLPVLAAVAIVVTLGSARGPERHVSYTLDLGWLRVVVVT